jgi:rhodanese-related sulfurtransferase
MRHKKLLLGLIIVVFCLFAWDSFWWALGVTPLLPYHLKAGLKNNPESFALIDVRTHLEYELFHINGAKNRPELLRHPELFQNSSKPLVVICMTGHRSSLVAYQLKKRVHQQVYNLTWGMLGWFLSGGDIRAD